MIINDFYYIESVEEKHILMGLSPSSKFILYLLKHHGPLKLKELLKKTLMPKRTVEYALKTLIELNFIKKSKDIKDKRISIFEVII